MTASRTALPLAAASICLSSLSCDAPAPIPAGTTIQVVGGDCRHEALGCSAGYACREMSDGAWECVPDGDAVMFPDPGPESDEGVGPADEGVAPPPDEVEPAADEGEPPPDPGPPAPLSIDLGIPPGVLSGMVVLGATVTGGYPSPVGVEFHVDGLTVTTDIIPPYSVVVNTADFADGTHQVAAYTVDQAGQTASKEATVIFDNTPPEIVAVSPEDDADLFFEDGPLTMSLKVADASILELVTLRANGLLVAELKAPPFEGSITHEALFLKLEKLPKNIYLQFRAEDQLGQSTEISGNVTMHSRLVWKYETLGDIWGGPAALPNGDIVFGNHEKKAYALSPQGAKVWELAVDDNVTAAPAVDESTGVVYLGTLKGTVYALTSQGAQKWSTSIGSPPGGSPALAGGKVFVVGFDGKVYELNASSGAKNWSASLPSNVTATPMADSDGKLYVGCQDGLFYALQSGVALWSVPTGDEVWSTAAIGDTGVVYFGSNDGWLYAAKGDGVVVWKTEIEGQLWGRVLMAADDLAVYVGSTSKRLHKVNAVDGAPIWNTKLGGITHSSPVQDADGNVYVGTTDGMLYGLSAETGEVLMKYAIGQTIHATPLVVGDRVFVGSMNRNMYGIWRAGADPDGGAD